MTTVMKRIHPKDYPGGIYHLDDLIEHLINIKNEYETKGWSNLKIDVCDAHTVVYGIIEVK